MARIPKLLHPIDREISRLLAALVDEREISQRPLAEQAGMSHNRLGKILRGEEPPATNGEIDAIARALGRTASSIVREAEANLTSGSEPAPATESTAAAPAREPHWSPVTPQDIAAGATLPLVGARPRRRKRTNDTTH
jgi:transcriptional regulator with XRE-family HTH domain